MTKTQVIKNEVSYRTRSIGYSIQIGFWGVYAKAVELADTVSESVSINGAIAIATIQSWFYTANYHIVCIREDIKLAAYAKLAIALRAVADRLNTIADDCE